ncbi:MAG: hypothetical protein FJY75_11915 [Candidatus Eisenbacteria bacterium]|uniref:Phospholipase D-like domain-containing protein n=1 Tax=Eiseniibacteriota bacterium TaxID=2212470 RepID=A0A937XCN7_UNCEI|nr:hypothetical protein [Candidatus Eisenbacteria bacterium]
MSSDPGALIEYRDEGGFHDAFRTDLLGLKREGIILSPFLRSARASEYYPLLGDLVRRQARIIVFTRPDRESAGEGRQEHARVTASLRGIGVDLRHRPGMHEKLAVLDRTILWHGSLNILSHGSSTESMLRLADPDLITRMLDDLRLDVASGEGRGGAASDPASDPAADPAADAAHAQPPVLSPAPAADATRARTSAPTPAPIIAARSDPAGAGLVRELDPACHCPRCGSAMTVKHGAHTRLACPDAGCGFEFDPRLSRWLLGARGRGRSA